MLMEAPRYWLMVLARLLQGFSSSVIWVAGLALLCDTVPESSVGKQLGLAMSGLSIGYLVGPPVSGALYSAFGFQAPFIFGIIVTMVDLIGRLLVIERSAALKWGFDPAAPPIAVEESEKSETQKTQIAVSSESDVPAGEKTKSPDFKDQENSAQPPTQATSSKDVQNIDLETSHSRAEHSGSPPDNLPRPISLLTVLRNLLTSSRAWATCASTMIYGMILTSQEPALPLHLQAVWHFNASKVGLVYIAAVVPTLFSSTLSGWWVDKRGTGAITVISLLFALPWLVLLIIQKSLVFFIVVFALSNFAISGTVSALTTEFATISRRLEGVGYAHVYGAFNLAYGVGSALGPIIGGQIYDHISQGWMAICLFGTGLCVAAILLAFFYFEDVPIYWQLTREIRRKRGDDGSRT